MKEFFKSEIFQGIAISLLVVCLISYLMGFVTKPDESQAACYDFGSRFDSIGRIPAYGTIYVDTETNVVYFINSKAFGHFVDQDGKPLLYDNKTN